MRPCGLSPSGAHRARHRSAAPCGVDGAPLHYERHRPEQTVPMLLRAKVHMPAHGLTFRPWANWAKRPLASPVWWTANNNVKHHRGQNFSEANLKNVLNAIAGLLLLLVLYQSQAGTHLAPAPKHFTPSLLAAIEGQPGSVCKPSAFSSPTVRRCRGLADWHLRGHVVPRAHLSYRPVFAVSIPSINACFSAPDS